MRTMSKVRDGDHIDICGDVHGDIFETIMDMVMLYWISCYENLNVIS
jgi:hypothetical protein